MRPPKTQLMAVLDGLAPAASAWPAPLRNENRRPDAVAVTMYRPASSRESSAGLLSSSFRLASEARGARAPHRFGESHGASARAGESWLPHGYRTVAGAQPVGSMIATVPFPVNTTGRAARAAALRHEARPKAVDSAERPGSIELDSLPRE
jgi:hypothetical protein